MNIELEDNTIDLPDGVYTGLWSAYSIRIKGTNAALATVDGCRSITGFPVIVRVADHKATATVQP